MSISVVIVPSFEEGVQRRLSHSLSGSRSISRVNLMCDETYDPSFLGSPYHVDRTPPRSPVQKRAKPKTVRFAKKLDIAPQIMQPKVESESLPLEPVRDFWSFHQELEEIERARRVNEWLDE